MSTMKRVGSREGIEEIMKTMESEGTEEDLDHLLENNRAWVTQKLNFDPQYFEKMSLGQAPTYLIIACSDSRVAPDTILGLQPGECFVHRFLNVANMVVTGDMNLLSVLEYAVHYLLVKHIIIIGHQYCGGCKAASGSDDYGLLEHWLRNIRDVIFKNIVELRAIEDEDLRSRKIVELNVKEQCLNLFRNPIVQRKQIETHGEYPTIHGFVYDMKVGLLTNASVDFENEVAINHDVYGVACKRTV